VIFVDVINKINQSGNYVVEQMLQDIKQYGLGEIAIVHINCLKEAKALSGIIMDKLKVDINISDIGPVIGLHVGPGAIGIAYYTERDMRQK
jgi:fatty acid-binding protein DegV